MDNLNSPKQANETLNRLEEVETKAPKSRNRAQDLQNECILRQVMFNKRACKITFMFPYTVSVASNSRFGVHVSIIITGVFSY